VTGCSSGIGRAIALRLVAEGWPVYATARQPDTIAELADLGCHVRRLDVTHPDSMRDVVAEIVDRHGAVGALVNNAGYGQQGPFEETPVSAFRSQFETNVFGVVALCQLVLPEMRRQNWGRIVNMSSLGGRVSFPGGAAYHGSKYALEAISDVMRFEVAGFGVRVIVIEPGPTASGFGEASVASMAGLSPSADGAYDEFRSGVQSALESTFVGDPAEGSSTPDEVAAVVVGSLTSDDPEPRLIVGAMADKLIDLKQQGSARDWDRLVGSMYPRPGAPLAAKE
jgi:NAD(P)-dependent dehydrogenase (short-subunit alcohol dehydrogenase family)